MRGVQVDLDDVVPAADAHARVVDEEVEVAGNLERAPAVVRNADVADHRPPGTLLDALGAAAHRPHLEPVGYKTADDGGSDPGAAARDQCSAAHAANLSVLAGVGRPARLLPGRNAALALQSLGG